MRIPLRAALLAATLTLLPGATAGAKDFKVYSCKLPDGSVAATDGWVADDPAFGFATGDSCGSGGQLRAAMANIGMPEGIDTGWTWSTPAALSLVSAELWRSAHLGPGTSAATPIERVVSAGSAIEAHGASLPYGDGVSDVGSGTWNAASNRLLVSAPSGSDVGVRVGCKGGSRSACPNSGGGDSQVLLHAATFTLADNSAPTVSAVSGSLTSSAAKAGDADVVLSASDTGAGVYRAIVSVDGVQTAAPVLDANGGRCRDVVPATADPYEFEYRVPCPASVSGARLVLDTRSLSDGDHRVSVEVEDASGNRTSAYGPATISVRNAAATGGRGTDGAGAGNGAGAGAGAGSDNGPATTTPDRSADLASIAGTQGTPNGVGATPDARLALPGLTVAGALRIRYGQTPTLKGRLTRPDGTPIAGARIEVFERTRLGGAQDRATGALTTDGSGSFSYRLPVGPSRNVRFAYRANTADTQPARTADVDVRVIPRITFKLSRTKLRNGQTLRFIGKIAGPHTKGRLAELRVRVGRRWVVVCVVRTRAGGALTCSYRFRNTFRPTRYSFRVVVRRQAGFPYEPVTSAIRTVTVRA